MPERGPLGLRRPLNMGPFAGEDAIVSVRLKGEIPDEEKQIVNVLADAVADQKREFLDFQGSSDKYMVSQAPVAVGEEFDHFTVTMYYPDSSISKRDVRSIRNEIQLRTERAESVNIMRV